MQAFEIAQRGNFVVVMFRVKPTIKVARFHRKGVVCNPVGDNEGLCTRAQIQSRSIGQLYVGRGGTNGIYKVTQLLPPEGDDHQYRKKPMNRTSGSSKKASRIALGDRRTAPLD
jgi:hypothetical protein